MARYFVVGFLATREGAINDPILMGQLQNTIASFPRAPLNTPYSTFYDIRSYPIMSLPGSEYKGYYDVYFLNEAAWNLSVRLGLDLPLIGEKNIDENEYADFALNHGAYICWNCFG